MDKTINNDCECVSNINNDLNIIGCDNFETFVINSNTVGIRPKWISIKERKPTIEECNNNYGWFLVIRNNSDRVDLSRYDGHENDCCYEHGWKYIFDDRITHFMVTPKPPKE